MKKRLTNEIFRGKIIRLSVQRSGIWIPREKLFEKSEKRGLTKPGRADMIDKLSLRQRRVPCKLNNVKQSLEKHLKRT